MLFYRPISFLFSGYHFIYALNNITTLTETTCVATLTLLLRRHNISKPALPGFFGVTLTPNNRAARAEKLRRNARLTHLDAMNER